MRAEIDMNISMDDLIRFVAQANGCEQLLRGNEYLALEPKVINDEVILKVLISDEDYPGEWRNIGDIKQQWSSL
jgi:hypothetical protein